MILILVSMSNLRHNKCKYILCILLPCDKYESSSKLFSVPFLSYMCHLDHIHIHADTNHMVIYDLTCLLDCATFPKFSEQQEVMLVELHPREVDEVVNQ